MLTDLAFWSLLVAVLSIVIAIITWIYSKKFILKLQVKVHDLKNEILYIKQSISVQSKPQQNDANTQINEIQKQIHNIEKKLQNLQDELHSELKQAKTSDKKNVQEVSNKKNVPSKIRSYAFLPKQQKGFYIPNLLEDKYNDNAFFVIEYEENSNNGEFYFNPEANFSKVRKYWDQYNHVIKEENDKSEFKYFIKNIENGTLAKENDYWKITKKLNIKYE